MNSAAGFGVFGARFAENGLTAYDLNAARVDRVRRQRAKSRPGASRDVIAGKARGTVERRQLAIRVIELILKEQGGLSRRVRRERENRAEEKRKSIQ
jgi:hypothetical protein